MVDNLDAQSTASSDISDSLREQILGIERRRKKEKGIQSQSAVIKENKSQNTLISNQFPPKEKGEISKRPSDALNRQNLSSSQIRGEIGNLGPTKSASLTKTGGQSSSLSYHTAEGSGGTLGKSGQNLSASQIQKNQNLSESQIQRGGNLSAESLFLKQENLSSERMKGEGFERVPSGQMSRTVAVQTELFGDVGECRCTCGEHEFVCTDCRCQNSCCTKKMPRKKCYGDYDETSDFSNFDNFTESSRTEIKRRHKKKSQYTCNCRNCVDFDTEQPISDSDDSCSSEFNDLPYQNNEEYLKLLRELEKKLMARNRDRVRKTMMEFERRSRLNQNLEKPVYDCSDDNATILQKLSPPKQKKTRCRCKCSANEASTNSDIMQNEKRWEEVGVAHETVVQASESCHPNNRIERSLHKSHWQLDPRSGEWVKVSSFQHTDFARPPGGGNRKECFCKQRKRH